MVRMQEPSEAERLDRLVAASSARHGLHVSVTGWARKTYDVYHREPKADRETLVARIESFATTSGEIRVFDDRALGFAQELGAGLEREFGLKEAVIVRQRAPE